MKTEGKNSEDWRQNRSYMPGYWRGSQHAELKIQVTPGTAIKGFVGYSVSEEGAVGSSPQQDGLLVLLVGVL